MEALFLGLMVLYIVGLFFFVVRVAGWLVDHHMPILLAILTGMFTWPLLLLVMWATKEGAPKKPELQAPLYGHNILEWRENDTLYDVAPVKPGDSHERYGCILRLKGWTDEGYVWGESGEVYRITPRTRNSDANWRKEKREAEQLRKSLERDAELAKLRAEEFQRKQSQS